MASFRKLLIVQECDQRNTNLVFGLNLSPLPRDVCPIRQLMQVYTVVPLSRPIAFYVHQPILRIYALLYPHHIRE